MRRSTLDQIRGSSPFTSSILNIINHVSLVDKLFTLVFKNVSVLTVFWPSKSKFLNYFLLVVHSAVFRIRIHLIRIWIHLIRIQEKLRAQERTLNIKFLSFIPFLKIILAWLDPESQSRPGSTNSFESESNLDLKHLVSLQHFLFYSNFDAMK